MKRGSLAAVLLLLAMKNHQPVQDAAPSTAALERQLAAHGAHEADAVAWIRAAFDGGEAVHAAGVPVHGESGRADALLVTRGWLARGVMLEDGRRQIVALHLPGDILTGLDRDDEELGAWTLTEAAVTNASKFLREAEREANTGDGVGPAWAAARAVERQRLIHQIIRLGRLTAYERTAHLLLELHEKQVCIAMSEAGQVLLPISQDVLADLLGLSAVHMNRTLQQLRRDRLIAYTAGKVMLPDIAGLRSAARLGLGDPRNR